jgi:hypothetical protein
MTTAGHDIHDGTRTPAMRATMTSTRNRGAKQQRPRCLPEGASCQLRE